MRTSDFDFELPDSMIALEPAEKRDSSKLMVLLPDGTAEHRKFKNITDYLGSGDMLVLNRTKVLPVRLFGRKPDGSTLDITLARELGGGTWEILSRGRYSGLLKVSPALSVEVEGGRHATLKYSGDLEVILQEAGQMPLPPYIKRSPHEGDKERYQTVYARNPGSIAAPTAGLHFTEGLLEAIEEKGVAVRYITLHVGTGTFKPIRTEALKDHEMAHEQFEIERSLIEEIKGHRGRLIAVGTTTTRALEGFFAGRHSIAENGSVSRGSTDIFIYPDYRFRVVDALLTNFHLPRSTPLMLASALAGRRRLLDAYAEAVRENYRFFSYGDAMLIL